ncbi:MAG: 1-acyl-sn-glycerol-3-phosphate acyltransferase [Thiolinea sp.]
MSSVRFLSKDDGGWPVIGWLATRAGTLYIRRGSKGAAGECCADTISERLQQGDVVLVFPG